MNITYNKQDLDDILTDLSILTGAKICFTDPNFQFILERGGTEPYCRILQQK